CPGGPSLYAAWAGDDRPPLDDPAWWRSHGTVATGAADASEAAWVIELLAVVSDPWPPAPSAEMHWYRILARGQQGPVITRVAAVVTRPFASTADAGTLAGWRDQCRASGHQPCGRQGWERLP
ncbi:MAG: hypothetical protein R3233_04760, partial [Xanthomonadales bacterium]|nr:hypothetical protein [Xanthomonadales bacterium]